MTPWLQDPDVTLYHGDVLETLRQMEAESVDCVVTSPPYWGLRDYGQEGQLGLEPTPERYVERMVEVFREVRRVLAAHGTVWLNLGDSYASDPGKGGSGTPNGRNNRGENYPRPGFGGLKQKDLVGIPWRVAFALQGDGWWLRSDIIWSKPNPMPESVTDRPTKAHEYVFLLSKQPRYFFDQEAVREAAPYSDWRSQFLKASNRTVGPKGYDESRNDYESISNSKWEYGAGRNIRSVWEIATQAYPEAHFATFPEELARRCIAAGCPEQVCRVCGKADCDCDPPRPALGAWQIGDDATSPHKHRPGTVLDPFIGSGTVAYVARKLGRHAVGIDLNESYLELAARRLQQQSLFAEVT